MVTAITAGIPPIGHPIKPRPVLAAVTGNGEAPGGNGEALAGNGEATAVSGGVLAAGEALAEQVDRAPRASRRATSLTCADDDPSLN